MTELTFFVSERIGEVNGLLERPAEARWLLVLAHGAGAGMRHSFLEALSAELARAGVATLRYQFPYMQHKRGRPDPPAVLVATVRAAVAAAAEQAPDLPLIAGGKSLGARVTSTALSEEPAGKAEALTRVRGLVFFGFPLHPPGQPGVKRAEHLKQVKVPMLFLQGTRDAFADLSLLRPICAELGARATLHTIETADHSFHVLKSSGRTDADIIRELAAATASWADEQLGNRE